MEKIWLNSYPPGVPAEVDVNRFDSLDALLAWAADRFDSQAAFSNQGVPLSWVRLDALARQFGAYLRQLGLGKGDRLAIMLPNLLQYPVALFGALRAGCIVVNVNPQYTARELQRQLVDSGASAIVVLDNFTRTLEQALPGTKVQHVITTRVCDLLCFPRASVVNLRTKRMRHTVPDWRIDGSTTLIDALQEGENLAPAAPALRPDDIAFVQYTGGTTGVPKGAVLTHRNILANVEQAAAWVRGVLFEGQETAILPLPLYHIFALTVMLAFARLGAHTVLITNPHNTPNFVNELKRARFTALIGVNTLFNALLDAEGIGAVDASSVKLVVAGAMALRQSVAQRWQQRFEVPIIEGYGLTEASPIVCVNPPCMKAYSGAVGLPLPSTEVRLFDDNGREARPGAIGEICVRGPQVMQGYWNMPEESAKVLSADGWLRTGDMGLMLEDGYLKVVDRKEDVINVSGFKVFPNEVEDVVAMHPGVFEVAAIRARDEHGHEAVKIVVVKRDQALSEQALLEHCRNNLTNYKVPKYVRFSSIPLPKSTIGKIERRLVMEDEACAAVISARAQARPAGEPMPYACHGDP
jgi:long-chain acyl-CoA synthetase